MTISIGNRKLGKGSPVLIVAEISANHDGDLQQALNLVRQAKAAGADAIKLQTYTADTITLKCEKPDFKIPKTSPWASYKTLWDLYNVAYTPWEWHAQIFEEANNNELLFFSSPFDHSAVDFLEGFDVCAYKVASPEINDVNLLKRIAKTKKPVIVSTGIARKEDIDLAVSVLQSEGVEIILLKCTTAYPTPIEEMGLLGIPMMRDDYALDVGLSDHSLGFVAPVVATALGAVIIEKHIKLDDNSDTVDGNFSLASNEFRLMCEGVREAEAALGLPSYDLPQSVMDNYSGGRSLYVAKNIKKGEILTNKNIRSVRPGFGLHTKYFDDIIGTKANKDLSLGDRLDWSCIDKS